MKSYNERDYPVIAFVTGFDGNVLRNPDGSPQTVQLNSVWDELMHSINREAGSERMFDYYLNKRHEYLQATGKTLLDFGVVGNDVAKLRRAFYVRIAKHTSQRALDALKGVEKELSSLKTERFLLPKDEDDFGLTEVKRRIALLSYATEEDESPSI